MLWDFESDNWRYCRLPTGKSGLGPLLVSGMLPLVIPRLSTLKVKAAIPLPLPPAMVGYSQKRIQALLCHSDSTTKKVA